MSIYNLSKTNCTGNCNGLGLPDRAEYAIGTESAEMNNVLALRPNPNNQILLLQSLCSTSLNWLGNIVFNSSIGLNLFIKAASELVSSSRYGTFSSSSWPGKVFPIASSSRLL